MTSDLKFLFTKKVILYIFPILAIAGVIIPIILGEFNLSLLGSYIAIPIFFAPMVYKKYIKNKEFPKIKQNYSESNNNLFLLLLIFYSIFFCISLILLVVFEIRPIIYYVVIAFLTVPILLEILLFEISHKKVIIILIQIIVLMLNMTWGVTLKYYYFIGRTDILAHTWWVNNLLSNGYVTDIFGLYKNFPLLHFLVAFIYSIINVSIPIYKIMFFINGIIFAFVILMIYLLSLKIFKNKRFALLSSLFASVNSGILILDMSPLPRSFVILFEIMLIFLLLDYRDHRKIFLVIILTFVIIVYHTTSMIPFIISILLLFYLLQRLYRINNPRFLNWDYLLLAMVANLAYWTFIANNVFEVIVGDIFKSAVTGFPTKSIVYTPLNELFNYLQYSPLLFFTIIGIIWTLEQKRISEFGKLFSIVALLLIGVAFPGPGLLLNKLSQDANLDRFSYYSLVLIVIIGAIGLASVYYNAGRKLKFIVIILFVAMTFLSISNDFNASDNPLVKRVFYTYYLNEEEVTAFDHIANITSGYVMSDYITQRYLEFSPYNSKSHFLEIDNNNRILRNNSNDVILIRDQELNKRPLRFFPSTTGRFELNPNIKGYIDYYYKDSPLWNNLEIYNKIYDSGGVSGFN